MLKQIKKQHDLEDLEDDEIDARDFIGHQSSTHQNSSVLFQGYRSLGYYASDTPFSVVKSDEDNLIASAVGKHAFYVYDCAHLNLVYMSKHIPEEILHVEATQDGFIYTALESS